MGIAASNSEGIDADSFHTRLRPGGRLDWDLELGCLNGLGEVNLILGGIMRFSRASTAFITEVRPDAPSKWPRLGFTEPM